MKVLVIGGGGREHAMCWKLARSPQVEEVHCAPGNAGIARDATCVKLADGDVPDYARDRGIGLVAIGPEGPLVGGMGNMLRARGFKVFGPQAKAATLEGSKVFAKQFMKRHGIPTADFDVAESFAEAEDAVRHFGDRVVVKADGLAAGKGVIVCSTIDEGVQAASTIMVDRAFGEAGRRVVVEKRLEGYELSLIAVTDGERYKMMIPAQDHKPLLDGDEGPNTGGMGAYCPARNIASPELVERIEREVIVPTLQGMREEERPIRGVLYAGLMIDGDGSLGVLEFNLRFGDPETQPQLTMMSSDLAALMLESDGGNVSNVPVTWHEGVAVTVVAAAEGYPVSPRKGDPITGLDGVEKGDERIVFHAGTSLDDGKVVVSGGRVLGITARGPDLDTARKASYDMIEKIGFKGMQYRRDIGVKGL
ncbi:MAG: phosphoribosylamine--glycine ligase [Deltaproteobacteria bacterium]|nr:phosphoribosylamine--glycine ligase [Deltaproteobacteria bacterium]